MMIEYRIRSTSLLNLVNDLRTDRLIPDAYFQRNLVWREVHKKDFIKTILLGYPFPQIFISRGRVDVETMSTVSCIVDGQQRTNAIIEYIDNQFDVDGKYYGDLSDDEKSDFLKYDIAVIELELENNDKKVQEIFHRINRTSNSLTVIEKLASEYSTSWFMLTAKFLSDQINLERTQEEDFREDPNIPDEFYSWANQKRTAKFSKLITSSGIFSAREIAKKTHLMHVLNMMASVLAGYYNRNEKALDFLNDYTMEFLDRDSIIDTLEATASIILPMRLGKKSYWYNKANIFSLVVSIARSLNDGHEIDSDGLKDRLLAFEKDIPDDYKLAATEAVNSTRTRQLRANYVRNLVCPR